jgi:HPt (histidine-containing phosphotransfer) domain-containing protein
MTAFLSKPITVEKLRAALEATSVLQSVAGLNAVLGAKQLDPLATLRQIAQRKGTPFTDEFAQFLAELGEENTALAAALQAREAAAGAKAAHRLVGRLAFVRADTAELMMREIESAIAAGHWPEAGQAWERYQQKLPTLLARLKAAAG